MGSSKTCRRTCDNRSPGVAASYVTFSDSDAIGARKSYKSYSCSGCSVVTNWPTVDNKATNHPYRTPSPKFTGDYDTGHYCINGVDCGFAFGDNKRVLNAADLTAKYMETIPTYTIPNDAGNGISTIDPQHPQNKYRADKSNNQYQLKKPLAVQQIKHTYTGQFKGAEHSGPTAAERADGKSVGNNSAASVVKRENVMWTYTVDNDINYFSDAVFSDWLYLIQTENALTMLLNEIRDFVNANPGLILLNKANAVMGTYVRNMNKDEKGFVDLPFGPPLIRIPNTYVLQYKGYYSNHKVNKTIDPANAVYNSGVKRPLVVNSISADKAASQYKPFNYLDNVYTTLNNYCANDACVNKDSVVTITVPMRGCQLFEALSDNQDTKSNQRIKVSSSLVSYIPLSSQQGTAESLVRLGAGKLPQIIMRVGAQLAERSSWQQQSDTTNSQAASAYELISNGMDIHVPIVNIKRQANGYMLDVNTLSDSIDNKVFLYIANTSKSLGSYVAKGRSQSNNTTGRQMNIVTVEYDGLETKETPMILVNRYNPSKGGDE